MQVARTAWLLAAAAVLVAAAAGSTLAVRAQAATSGWVAHTYQVIAEMENALSFIAEAEAAQRTFLLTGVEAQAQRAETIAPRVLASLDRLHRLTADNPPQQARIRDLQQSAAKRLDLLHTLAQARREQPDVPIGVVQLDAGQRQMADVRARIDTVRQEEERLLETRLREAVHASWLGVASTVGTGVLALLLLGLLHVAATRHARQLEASNRQLAEQAATLELRVQERTAELRDANEVLQGFAHSIAHDLRAPLRNIEGFANVLLEDEAPRLSDAGVGTTRRLAEIARRMDGLITDLLAYSRVARQQMVLHAVPLRTVVDRVLAELEPEVRASGARIDVGDGLPAVTGHADMLTQALANLIGNALKFCAPGSAPHVEVSARRAGPRVLLDVTDDGIGIAPADQERIFTVFERLHGPQHYPGSGVGLAIVRKIAERLGGSVSVSSAAGRGATFTLDLPAAREEAA